MAQKEVNLTPQQVSALLEREKAKVDVIRQQQSFIQQALLEVAGTLDSLKAIKDCEKGEKILVSLGAGIFTYATIEDNQKVKNAFAGGVMLDKSIDDSIKVVEDRRAKLQDEGKRLVAEESAILQNLGQLSKGMAQLREKVRQKAIEKKNAEKKD